MGWLAGWSYRRAITVDNTGNASTLTNYPVSVSLTSSNMTFAHAQSAGQDIRFTDSDGTTLLSYWFDQEIGPYDSGAQTATIWIKVPSITGSASQTIYLYYGNAGASDAQSISGTFFHGNDYPTANVSANYKALASDAVHYGFAAQYSSPAATFFTDTYPRALYDSTSGKTFGVYGKYNSLHVIWTAWTYNHSTGALTFDDVTNSPGSTDAHANPAILMDASGFLYIIGTTETAVGACRKSNSARDISAWTDIGSPSTADEYASLFFISTTLYNFTRHSISGTAPSYQKSYGYYTWNGSTWSSYNEVVNFTHADSGGQWNPYVVSRADALGNIHLAWGLYENTAANYRNKLWYAYSTDGGSTWKKRDGTAITLPCTAANSDNLNSSTSVDIFALDLQCDSSGNPYILTIEGVTKTGSSDGRGVMSFCCYHYSSGWQRVVINALGDHIFDRGCLKLRSDTDIRAYLTVAGQLEKDGGEIWEYVSTDSGATWALGEKLTTSSTPQNSYPVTVVSANNDLEVIWSSGDGTTYSGSGELRGWGRNHVLTTTSQPESLGYFDENADVVGSSSYSLSAVSGKVQLTSSAANGQPTVFTQTDLAKSSTLSQHYVRSRWKPTTLAGSYRFQPAMLLYSPVNAPATAGSYLNNSNNWAEAVFWGSTNHLQLAYTSSRGAAATFTSLVATDPIVNHEYLVELWHTPGTTTCNIRVTDITAGSGLGGIYSGSKTTVSRDSAVLVGGYSQYTNDSANVSLVDDFIVRSFTPTEPSQTVGTEEALATGTTGAILPSGIGYMGLGLTKAVLPSGLGYMG